jgi:hypothetical protein
MLTCTGTVPLGACAVTPSLVTFTGVSAVPITVTISTKAGSAAGVLMAHPVDEGRRPLELLILGMTLAMIAARRKRMRPKGLALAMAGGLSLIFIVAVSLSGCGGGGAGTNTSPPPQQVTGTPVGSYTFTVTAKSASSVNPDQSVNLLLNVK